MYINRCNSKIYILTVCLVLNLLSLTACRLEPSPPPVIDQQPVSTSAFSATPLAPATHTPTTIPAYTPTPTFIPTPVPTFAIQKLGTIELDIPYCATEATISLKADVRTMDIRYPSSLGPWPVIIYLHGGSWYQGDKSESAGWHFLTGADFLVVSVNYRLADGQVKFPKMIQDIKCAVRDLRANAVHYNLDPQRMAVIGWSAGAHLAGLLATADESAGWDVGAYLDQSSRVQAVVSIAGIADLSGEMGQALADDITFAFGQPGGISSRELTIASPVTYISPDDPPFFIIHGTLDEVVRFEQSEILYARLIEAGVPSSFLMVKNAYHSLRGPEASMSRFDIKMLVYAFLVERLGEP